MQRQPFCQSTALGPVFLRCLLIYSVLVLDSLHGDTYTVRVLQVPPRHLHKAISLLHVLYQFQAACRPPLRLERRSKRAYRFGRRQLPMGSKSIIHNAGTATKI